MASDTRSVDITEAPPNTSDQPDVGTHEHRIQLLSSLYPTRRRPGHERKITFRIRIWDRLNVRPPVPPPYSQIEQAALDQWRLQVGERIERRIATFKTHVLSELPTAKASYPRSSEPLFCAVQTIFDIPELHDMVFDFAGPEVQVRALWVSKSWRASAIRFMSSGANRTASAFMAAGTPLEYDCRSPCRTRVRSYSDRQAQLASDMRGTAGSRWTCGWRKYEHIQDLISQWRNSPDTSPKRSAPPLVHNPFAPPSINHELLPYIDYSTVCLDLSQLQINPYLSMLFSEEHRITRRLGRWEIGLRAMATLDTLLLAESAPQRLLIKAIGLMQVANPPCRCLGLYYPETDKYIRPLPLTLLRRLRRDDGIRVIDLLTALETIKSTVLSKWTKDAEELREHVKKSHWIDNIWTLPGSPTIRIYLDNGLMADEPPYAAVGIADRYHCSHPFRGDTYSFRRAYMIAEPSRDIRQGEWVPEELFEPMESQTGRAPINWMYT